MKTTIIYFGLIVSLFGNTVLANSKSNDRIGSFESVLSFDKGVRLTKPEVAVESDTTQLNEVLAPIASADKNELDLVVAEGYKITESQPQEYQVLTIQPTIKDTILFNESVIESDTLQNRF